MFSSKMNPSKTDTSPSSEQRSTEKLIKTPKDHFHVIQPLEPISSVPFHISTPTLSILPREIQDIIYTNLIAASSLIILRTSKGLFQEASHFLYKRGICRLVLPLRNPKYTPDFPLTNPRAAAIQNFNIRLGMRAVCGRDLEIAELFGVSAVCRRRCHVFIENDADEPYAPEERLAVPEVLLNLFRTFTGFALLAIRLRFVGCEQMLRLLQSFKSQLEGSLGAGVRYGRTEKDWERQYLEFHSRGYWEIQQERVLLEG